MVYIIKKKLENRKAGKPASFEHFYLIDINLKKVLLFHFKLLISKNTN